MIKRIYIKSLSIADTVIGRLHLFLESKGLLKELKYSVANQKQNATRINHPYPINYNPEHKLFFDHYTNYDTFDETLYAFTNVNVAERGVIFKGFNNTWLSFPHVVFRAEFGWLYILKNYLFRKKRNTSPDKNYVLLYDFWSSANYYHWLVDSLPRLMDVSELLQQSDNVLLLPKNCPKYIINTLKYFKINSTEYLSKNEYLSIQKLLLPYYAVGSGRVHPEKVWKVKNYFLDRITGNKGTELIYVSRAKQKARRVSNEKEFIEILKQAGFSLIFFEDYTFEEQVQIARKAKIMVSSHGANLTNLMFMTPGTKVFELIKNKAPNFCYWQLASVAKVNYYYQLCEIRGNDHLFVDLNEFKINLEKLLNE